MNTQLLLIEPELLVDESTTELLSSNIKYVLRLFKHSGSTVVFIKIKESKQNDERVNNFIFLTAFIYSLIKNKKLATHSEIFENLANLADNLSTQERKECNDYISEIISSNLKKRVFLEQVFKDNLKTRYIFSLSSCIKNSSLESIMKILDCTANEVFTQDKLLLSNVYNPDKETEINIFRSETKGYGLLVHRKTSILLFKQLYTKNYSAYPPSLKNYITNEAADPFEMVGDSNKQVYTKYEINQACSFHISNYKTCYSTVENKFVCCYCETQNKVILLSKIKSWINRFKKINKLCTYADGIQPSARMLEKLSNSIREQIANYYNGKINGLTKNRIYKEKVIQDMNKVCPIEQTNSNMGEIIQAVNLCRVQDIKYLKHKQRIDQITSSTKNVNTQLAVIANMLKI